VNDDLQDLRDAGYKPICCRPQPFSFDDLLRNVDPAPDVETERFVAAIYADRRQACVARVRTDSFLHVNRGIAHGRDSAGWGNRRRLLLERFMQGFELVYADNNLCTVWASIRADARAGRQGTESAGRLDRGHGIGARRPARNQQPARFDHVRNLRLLSL